MALTGCCWGVSTLQNQSQQLRLSSSGQPLRLQVTCKAQSTKQVGSSSKAAVDQKKKKKKQLLKKKIEKRSAAKKRTEGEEKDGYAVIPKMSEWIKNKPSGFGLEEYDTLIEEKLLEGQPLDIIQKEFEQQTGAEGTKSRMLKQIKEKSDVTSSTSEEKTKLKPKEKKDANLVSNTSEEQMKQKRKDGKLASKLEEQSKHGKLTEILEEEAKSSKPARRITLNGGKIVEKTNSKPVKKPDPKPEPAGIRVKVTHLPKKKNIVRDLREAFKNVQGLLFIKANELANKKTRDPVCKGSALLTFANEKNATYFMEKFKTRKLVFGKVDKILSYELHGKVQAVVNKLPIGPNLKVRDPGAISVQPASEDESELANAIIADGVDDDEDEESAEEEEGEGFGIEAEVDSEPSDEFSENSSDEEDEQQQEQAIKVGIARLGSEDSTSAEDSYDEDFSSGDEDFSSGDEDFCDELGRINGNSTELEFKDSDDEDSSEDDQDDETFDDGELDKQVTNGTMVEVDVSEPLTAKDLGGDPETIVYASTEKIEQLDQEISRLKKKLRRVKSQELKDQILKLREEKIELLEKRVLARFVAAREAYKAKRAKKKEASSESMKTRSMRTDKKLLTEIVSKHFTAVPES